MSRPRPGSRPPWPPSCPPLPAVLTRMGGDGVAGLVTFKTGQALSLGPAHRGVPLEKTPRILLAASEQRSDRGALTELGPRVGR